ncbi:MAG TPA: hypothetical protein VEO54_32135 [Thermoanaerobaculia bacterium]|nr:hypothetical protein [Thermoanaerobaculia bacterium]
MRQILTAAIAAFLVCIAAVQAAAAPRQDLVPRNVAQSAVVREAYRKLSAYHHAAHLQQKGEGSETLADGLRVRFALGNFRSGPIADILDRAWHDYVTPPRDEVVLITPGAIDVNGIELAFYDAEWAPGRFIAADSEPWRVREVLALEPDRFHDVGSYTSYDVTVTLEGRSRTYHALVLHHDLYAAAEVPEPEFFDHIAGLFGQVGQAWKDARPAYETAAVRRTLSLPAAAAPKPAGRAAGKVASASSRCEAFQAHGLGGHISGEHGGAANVCLSCVDEGDGYHSCRIDVDSEQQWDYGQLESYYYGHYGRTVSRGAVATAPLGSTVACSGGVGVGFKECYNVTGCNVNISITVGGAGVTVQGGDLWSAGSPYKISCYMPKPTCVGNTGGFDDGYVGGDRCSAGTPIVIDMAGNDIALTDAATPVSFDLNADGLAERISWTAAGTDDAFLALDRNGNGRIDDGAELFGNFTPQPESAQQNGFLALAEYDKLSNGGNGDGVIDAGDAVFASLVLWTDADRNGISEAAEQRGLAASAVQRLDLDYKDSRRVDAYGNQFRYRAKVVSAKKTDVGHWAWDVFLTTMPN